MKRRMQHLLAIAALATVCGCQSSTPYLDSRFGYTVNTAKAMQTINPNASKNRDPVSGIDGPAAKEGMDRYIDSFKAPQETFEVLTGAGSGGSR